MVGQWIDFIQVRERIFWMDVRKFYKMFHSSTQQSITREGWKNENNN